ncbi:MAG: hydrogenase maturation nickel metallochaperone HypA, partial [Desulfobacterales bacterium]|nr:hydrogenase maturation nickel metallochaperone HypA [Desulfobacterales bacterium]
LIETVSALCQKEGYNSIESVRLKVGKAAGILPDALLFAFDVAKSGTLASHAELVIEYIPLGGFCRECGSQFESRERYIFACPDCKSSAIKITKGDEMQIIDMEVN